MIAAARIMDSAASRDSQLDDDARLSNAVLAVLAFAMHGNFASAAAAARREGLLALPTGTLTPAVAAALGVSLPNHVSQRQRRAMWDLHTAGRAAPPR